MAQEPKTLRVLLVEDDNLVAMLVEDMLADLGWELAKNPRNVAEALLYLEAPDWDVAILDVNVAGERVFPVADALQEGGRPFIFASGYGTSAIPDVYEAIPVIAKPFRMEQLQAALLQAASFVQNH